MSRAQRALSGVVFGLVFQLLVLTVGLWLTPLLLRRLGTHDYGLWLVATQILGYLSLLDLGVVGLLPREVAWVTGKSPPEERGVRLAEMMRSVRRLVRRQLAAVAGVAVAIWLLIPTEWAELRGPLALVLVGFTVCFPLRIYQACLQGLQELGFLSRVNIVSWGLSTALTVTWVLWHPNLLALSSAWLLNQGATALLCRLRLRTLAPELFERRGVEGPSWSFEWLKRGLWVSLSQVSQAFVSGSDLLLVGKLFGPATAVQYGCTAKLIQVFQNYPTLLISNAAPGISELRGRGDLRKVLEVCATIGQAMLLVSGLIASVVLASNQAFVTWWVGGEQLAPASVSLVLCWVMMLRHWNSVSVYSIFAFGEERHISVTSLLDGVTGLLAGAFLSQWVGLTGVALGALTGVALVSVPRNLWALRRLAGIRVTDQLRATFPWLWRFAVTAAAISYVAAQTRPEGFLGLAISALLAAALYILVMAPMAMKSPVAAYGRQAVNELLRRARAKWGPARPATHSEPSR